MNTFFTRTLTAVVFVAVMLGGILWNATSFFLLFLFIGLLTLQEYFRLAGKISAGYATISKAHRFLVLMMALSLFVIVVGDHFHFGFVSSGFAGICLAVLLLLIFIFSECFSTQPFRIKNAGWSLLGLIYAVLPFCLLVDIRLENSQVSFPLIPLGLICCIWINDTMAYIVGSLIGRTKFFPAISPKKTWEGSVGGVILTILAAGLFGYFGHYYTLKDWIVIGTLASVTGTIGDLLESKLKRMAGIKDSGSIMPGHGGFLDRFDSLILATPFVWLYVQCFM